MSSLGREAACLSRRRAVGSQGQRSGPGGARTPRGLGTGGPSSDAPGRLLRDSSSPAFVAPPKGSTRMKAPRLALPAVAIFLLSFGLFAFTTSKPGGYELETVAVSEGLVRTGHFEIDPSSPLLAEVPRGVYGHLGKDKRVYGRTLLVQPLLEAPLIAAGLALDNMASDGHRAEFRRLLAQFYNPLLAALTAVALFFI